MRDRSSNNQEEDLIESEAFYGLQGTWQRQDFGTLIVILDFDDNQ